MGVTSGLVAKGAAGTAAVAAATAAVALKDNIADWFSGEGEGNPINTKLKGLGLPGGCEFKKDQGESDCGKLTVDILKALNFDKKTGTSPAITGSADKVTLKIKRDEDEGIFPNGIKIIFENEDAEIKSDELKIDWDPGTNPEYKIEGGKLKNAWTPTRLANKVGFTACDEDEGTEECTLGQTLNVFISNDSYALNAKVETAKVGEKMSYESKRENSNQGIRFKIEEGLPDIIVKGGEKTITLQNGSFFEVKKLEVNGQKNWFLAKMDSVEE